MKKLSILIIKFYRKYLSPLKKPCCKYYPTCSTYAMKAYEKHGVIKGFLLSFWRILRCNPWSLGGVDHVPDEFFLYTLKSRGLREKSKNNINFENKE